METELPSIFPDETIIHQEEEENLTRPFIISAYTWLSKGNTSIFQSPTQNIAYSKVGNWNMTVIEEVKAFGNEDLQNCTWLISLIQSSSYDLLESLFQKFVAPCTRLNAAAAGVPSQKAHKKQSILKYSRYNYAARRYQQLKCIFTKNSCQRVSLGWSYIAELSELQYNSSSEKPKNLFFLLLCRNIKSNLQMWP